MNRADRPRPRTGRSLASPLEHAVLRLLAEQREAPLPPVDPDRIARAMLDERRALAELAEAAQQEDGLP